MGDPNAFETFVGQMISESEENQLAGGMALSVKAGAKLIAGGSVDGVMFEATLLEKVGRDQNLYRKEAFGPVALLEAFDEFGAARAWFNASDLGLQTGVFNDSLAHAYRAWDELEVGSVKDSGLGREGVWYAIEDMTEPRLMVIRNMQPREAGRLP